MIRAKKKYSGSICLPRKRAQIREAANIPAENWAFIMKTKLEEESSRCVIQYLLEFAEYCGQQFGLHREISHLETMLRAFWGWMHCADRQKFHTSDEVREFCFGSGDEGISDYHYESVETYIHQFWRACSHDPETANLDSFRQVVALAWHSLSPRDQDRVYVSAAIAPLAAFYEELEFERWPSPAQAGQLHGNSPSTTTKSP